MTTDTQLDESTVAGQLDPRPRKTGTGRYTDEEREAVRELVDRIFRESGAQTAARFARHIGVSELSLSGWRTGREMPDAVNLLRLLHAAGVVGPAPGYELPGSRIV